MATTIKAAGNDRAAAAHDPKAGSAVPCLSVAERVARGKAARKEVPRADHARFEPASSRADPVELLERQAKTRVAELVPIRYGRMLVSPFTAIAVALVVVAGCGGSSKPAYCTDRSNLNSSVKGLKSAAASRNVDDLKSSATKVQSDATSVVSSAKSDFPTETSAVKSSVDTLKSAVDALPASPTPQDLAPTVTGAASVVTSVENFSDASKSKCS